MQMAPAPEGWPNTVWLLAPALAQSVREQGSILTQAQQPLKPLALHPACLVRGQTTPRIRG